MTRLNELVTQNDVVKRCALSLLKESFEDYEAYVPRIPQRLLYGTFSDEVHNPDISTVFVLSDESEEYKLFFKALCKRRAALFEEVDATAASHFVEMKKSGDGTP